jgi:hypothetical protein
MKKILTALLVVTSSFLFGQGFTYSYVDPCSKQTKVLSVNSSQLVTVNYLGNINSFNQNDFLNGTFDNWINQIQTQAANQPCDELLTNTQSSQNMFITQNLISTLTSITASSTMIASNAISNSVSNSSNNGNSSGKRNSANNQNTSNNGTTNQSNNTSSGSLSSSSTTTNGGTQSGTNTGSSQQSGGGNNTQGEGNKQNGGNPSGAGNSTEGGSGQAQPSVNNPSSSNTGNSTQSGTNPTDGPKQETTGGGGGGTTNSVSNAVSSTSGSKSRGKSNTGGIVGTGDIVAIRVNEDKSSQLRGTMSVTKSNTNNTRAKGLLLNFTSTVNNTNLTLYGAFNNTKRTNTFIIANSSMIDFERNFFNTTTMMDSKKIGKTAFMGGLNFTVGGLGGEVFTNLSAVGGGFHPFKLSQKISGNILVLGVYSPFTKFYEGKWWDSGLLIVPFSSWDYTISKNFKYNISLSGTYELKGSVLQFQVLTGGKILL